MESKRIRELLEKFYEANSTKNEEFELYKYFKSDKVTDDLLEEKDYFLALYSVQKENIKIPIDIDKRIEEVINESPTKAKSEKKAIWLKFFNAAATVIIIIGASFLIYQGLELNKKVSKTKDTYDSVDLAYMQTKRILYFVSSKMNEGTAPLNELKKLNSGSKHLYELNMLDNSIKKLSTIKTTQEQKR